MFNFDRSENKNTDNKNIKSDWLEFLSLRKKENSLSSIADVKFAKEDLKIRSMVIETLEKEFGKNIKDIKNYEFLVDSVVDRLKKKQLESETPDIENR